MLESLENRALFSMTLAGGDLLVEGRTLTNDSFQFTQINSGTQIRVEHRVRFSNKFLEARVFSASQINRIFVNLGRGDDRMGAGGVTKKFTIDGGKGDDLIGAGDNADFIQGGEGDDTIFGGRGSDVLRGGADDDRLDGELGNDLIFGDSGNDVALNPETGDQIDLGSGQDGIEVTGTNGNDDIFIDRVVRNGKAHARLLVNGVETLVQYINGETVTVNAGHGDDLVTFSQNAGQTWKARFFGGWGNDTLIGAQSNDTLNGNEGDDILIGRGGNDWLVSGLAVR